MDPFEINKIYFPAAIQQYVYFDKYAKFNRELGRREVWPESVERVVDFLRELSEDKLSDREYKIIQDHITSMAVAPSMRLFATAGAEARRNHVSVYNCCYLPVASLEAFTELFWVSMSGVGAGYSVENRYTSLLPRVQVQHPFTVANEYVIEDSAAGWVKAFGHGLKLWFGGHDVVFNYDKIRPAGALLKTKGGTASGPDVLRDLLDFARDLILSKQGQKLQPVDVFDICTMIASCAVSGGSRRSAQLAMFDSTDTDMLNAKKGAYWEHSVHRANANISMVIDKLMDEDEMLEFMELMDSGQTGEPGLVSRLAMAKTKPVRRRALPHGGVNACAEINLQGATRDGRLGGQFCNLSTVQVYPHDDLPSLERKVRIATIIGTIQSMATDFKLLRPEWKEICEEERLIGVSLIGLMDNAQARDPWTLKYLRTVAIKTNMEYADKLGINQAAAVTCIKPSGNSSVLFGTARGLNARFADYYKRRVRVNAYTPIYQVLRESGVPMSPENGQQEPDVSTYVATFYEKSPDGAVTMDNLTTRDQLNNWKIAKDYWCEHNPSVTIEYAPKDVPDMAQWLYANQDRLNGIAFLPRTEHIYQQAPYEKLSKNGYNTAIADYPEIDFSLLEKYELEDQTERSLECSAGVCDLT